MTPSSDTSPLACDLAALTPAERERRAELARLAGRAAPEVAPLPDGYALRFPPDPALFVMLAELVALEHRCCPFLRLALEQEPAGGPAWLRLTGAEGAPDFLAAELGLGSAR